MTDVTRHLIGLGHRRIVLLARADRRLPEPGASERAFLNELEAQNIITGAYNLPEWEETASGMGQLLETLFRFTPPTAIIVRASQAGTELER